MPVRAYDTGNSSRPYVLGLGAKHPTLWAEQQAARHAVAEWLGLAKDHNVWDAYREAPMINVATGRRIPVVHLEMVYSRDAYLAQMTLTLQHPFVDVLL